MTQPHLTFACELETPALQELFTDPAVIQDLVAIQASISLGLIDLSPERAAVVRRLNEAGIPVIAWLLLPKEQGYWFNAGNAPQATARYEAFQEWTKAFDLQWAGVAMDIEPDFWEFQQLLTGRIWRPLPRMIGRLFDSRGLREAEATYSRLAGRMRADGYLVESYHFPFVADERKAGSTFLRRLLGLVEVPADREGFMLYTSFFPGWGPAVLCSYAPEAELIAVGVTGGGVDTGPQIPTLSWDELARDLRLARQWRDHLAIFSLEGCVRQGYMDGLKTFDWEQPAAVPQAAVRQVDRVRKGFRVFLWASAHPWTVLAGFVGLMLLVRRLGKLLAPTRKQK